MPAFLPIGTEVSAKYRGAFCEAKVKKALKRVVMKVSEHLVCIHILSCHYYGIKGEHNAAHSESTMLTVLA